MKSPRRAGFTHLLLTLLLALVCAALGYQLLGTTLEGKVGAGSRSTYRMITAASDPVGFAARAVLAWLLWLAACWYVWFRFKVWLRRDEDPAQFESQVADLEKTTSREGNVLAWILATPFILLFLLVLVGWAMGLGRT